jgi:DNA-binding transcriptional ArsR family regulator
VEKRLMEDLDVTATQQRILRILSKGEFETFERLEETKRRGFTLNPRAEWMYYRLLDKLGEKGIRMLDELEDKKRRELVKTMFREYEDQVEVDELRLKEFSEGTSISTKQEAIEFFVRDFPNFKRLLNWSDAMVWLLGYLQKIRGMAEENVEGFVDYYLMVDVVKNPEAFGYEKGVWPFIMPQMSYVKVGLDSLEFSFAPYAVITLKVHRAEHKKTLRGWSYTYPSSDEPLFLYTYVLDSFFLDMSLPKIILPLKLLRGLASGDIQPSGCEVIKQKDRVLTYRVEGFEAEVILPHDFVTFLMNLGEEPLKALHELGLLDELTLQILESKKGEGKPLELPTIREKDRKYLGIIQKAEGFLTYGGWGEALELTRDGAYRTLMRLEEDGLVNIEKHESGEGVRVSLTTLGLAAIR